MGILLRYRPIAALLGRIRGELWITCQDEEYLCRIQEGEPFSYGEDLHYHSEEKCSTFMAEYWYTDEDGEVYLNCVTMLVTFDKLFQIDKLVIEPVKGGMITYSLPVDEDFKELVGKTVHPFGRNEDSSGQ